MMRIVPGTTLGQCGVTCHSARQQTEPATEFAAGFTVFPAES